MIPIFSLFSVLFVFGFLSFISAGAFSGFFMFRGVLFLIGNAPVSVLDTIKEFHIENRLMCLGVHCVLILLEFILFNSKKYCGTLIVFLTYYFLKRLSFDTVIADLFVWCKRGVQTLSENWDSISISDVVRAFFKPFTPSPTTG
jgi:hypothetical protein